MYVLLTAQALKMCFTIWKPVTFKPV